MTDANLITKISSLPENLKKEVMDFIEFLESKSKMKTPEKPKRTLGLAKGLIIMKKNFDDPIEDFKEYM